MIERVFREPWGRVLASTVGYVGDFDLAEEVDPGGVRAEATRTTATIVSVAQVPIGASNARSGRVPPEDELR